jgi:predicted Zn-dependent protease
VGEDAPEGAFDLSPEELDSAHALARQLGVELAGDGERFMALEQACDTDLLSLLADLPGALAMAEKVDEGAELARLFAFLDPPHFLGERALLLAEADRREEALAQVTENLESMSADAWVEVKAADVYGALGDTERAEGMLRAVLARKVDQQARDGAFDRLLDLLSEQGRAAECEALLAAERARLDASVKARAETEQRLAPKVGRNDPCPCGSGKKHKKCCLV